MASIHPHRDKWRVFFRVNGQQLTEVHPTKKAAEQRRLEIELALSKGRHPITGNKLIEGVGIESEEAQDIFCEWSKQQGRAERTLDRDLDFIPRFLANSPQFIRMIDSDHVDEFVRSLTGTPSNINKGIAALRAFFRCMKELNHIEKNPALHLKHRKMSRKMPDLFAPDEITAIISNMPDHIHPFAFFVATTGCRISEATNLKWKDVDLPRVTIRSPKERHDKLIVLPQELASRIRKLKPVSEYVFVSTKGTSLIHNVRRVIRDAAKKAVPELAKARGIEDKESEGYKIYSQSLIERAHWHTFRHTVATNLVMTESPAVVQKLLGHARLSTTEMYVHIAAAQMSELADHGLSEWHAKISKCVTKACNNPTKNDAGSRIIPSSKNKVESDAKRVHRPKKASSRKN